MISKWCDTVNRLSENPRRLLAHCIAEADDRYLASQIDPNFEDIEFPQSIEEKIGEIVIRPESLKTKEQIDCTLEIWKDFESCFYETRACQKAIASFDEKGILTLIGPPGEGKSITAHHIALKYLLEGYPVFPVIHLEELESLWTNEVEQIFVLDDPVGSHSLEEGRLSEWVTKNDKVKGFTEKGKTKIIATIRKTIYQQCKKEINKTIFSKNVVDLSADDLQLNASERKNMLKRHCEKEIKHFDEIVSSSYFPGFPLLCHFLKIDPTSCEEIEKDLNPSHVVLNQIEELAAKSKPQYCSLVLSAMFHGSFYPQHLNSLNRGKRKKNDNKMEEIIKNCELEPSPENIGKIKSSFFDLKGVYFVEKEDVFYFLHDTIFSAVAFHFGKGHIDLILEYCSSKFIRERVRIKGVKETEPEDQDFTKLTIPITKMEYENFAERLTKDITELNYLDVFRNPSIYNEEFQEVWTQQLVELEEEELKNIMSRAPKREMEKYAEVLKNLKKTLDFAILSSAPFHWLCRHGMLTMLQKILTKCQNANDVLASLPGHTQPLHFAAGYGHLEVVKYLVDLGEDANSKSCLQKEQIEEDVVGEYYTGFTPLLYAARENHLEVVKYLLEKGALPNLVRDHGASPMLLTADRGHYKVVETLIKHGADPNLCCDHGTSPLILAASENHVKTAKVLIEAGADLNKQKIENGVSAVLFAASRGHCETLKLLLDSGADLNLCNKKGLSPLAISIEGGHLEAAQMLLDRGASVEINDEENNSPLLYAVKSKYKHGKTSELSDRYSKFVKKLIDKGANFLEVNKNGESAKSVAEENGGDEIIKIIEDAVQQ